MLNIQKERCVKDALGLFNRRLKVRTLTFTNRVRKLSEIKNIEAALRSPT